MSQPPTATHQQVEIQPLAALSVAQRQIAFDANEKLLLANEAHLLRLALQESEAKVKELEEELDSLLPETQPNAGA